MPLMRWHCGVSSGEEEEDEDDDDDEGDWVDGEGDWEDCVDERGSRGSGEDDDEGGEGRAAYNVTPWTVPRKGRVSVYGLTYLPLPLPLLLRRRVAAPVPELGSDMAKAHCARNGSLEAEDSRAEGLKPGN